MAQIHESLAAMLADVEAITKSRKNSQQGYNFRGIDDVYNAIHPLLAKHKVFPTCEITERHQAERETRAGGALFYTNLKVRYTLWAADGSNVWTEAWGEAMDSGDKASNKAMSAAYKYALFQLLCIPTEALADTEQDSYDVGPSRSDVQPQPARRPQPRRPAKPPCPECGKSESVFADKEKAGHFYCWKKKDGCGAKWAEGQPPAEPAGEPESEPFGGGEMPDLSQLPLKTGTQVQEEQDSFAMWAELLLKGPETWEAGVRTIRNAIEKKRLTPEHTFEVLKRAIHMAQTEQQLDLVEKAIMPLKDASKMPDRLFLQFGELVPEGYDRIAAREDLLDRDPLGQEAL